MEADDKFDNPSSLVKNLAIELTTKTKVSRKAEAIKKTLDDHKLMKLKGDELCIYKNPGSFIIYSKTEKKLAIIDKYHVTAFIDHTPEFSAGIFSCNSYYFSLPLGKGTNELFKLDHVSYDEEKPEILMLESDTALIQLMINNFSIPNYNPGPLCCNSPPLEKKFTFLKAHSKFNFLYLWEDEKNCIHIFNSKTNNPSDTFTIKFKEKTLFYEDYERYAGIGRVDFDVTLEAYTKVKFFSSNEIIIATDYSRERSEKFCVEIITINLEEKKIMKRVMHKLAQEEEGIDYYLSSITPIVKETGEKYLLIATKRNHLHLLKYNNGVIQTLKILKTDTVFSNLHAAGPLDGVIYPCVFIQSDGRSFKIHYCAVVGDDLLRVEKADKLKKYHRDAVPVEYWNFGTLLLGKENLLHSKIKIRFVNKA